MPDGETRLPPVSTTAIGVAAIRAAEADQAAPLFADPLAPSFVDAARSSWTINRRDGNDEHVRRRVGALVLWVRVRTRFLDEIVTRACAAGGRQVVVLGAGLDARAFRLPLTTSVRWFELDLPGVLEFKERVVHEGGFQPACERVVVPTDLDGAWTADLDRGGFDATQPSIWLAEGLLAYLTETTREAVVDEITRRSVPGSRFGVTLASADRRTATSSDPATLPSRPGDYVSLWQSDAPPDVDTWLGPRGWTVDVFDAIERAAAYGIDVPTPTQPRYGARLVDATRHDAASTLGPGPAPGS